MAQYILSHNENSIDNLNYIFSVDPEFLTEVFNIKKINEPFLDCLKLSKDDDKFPEITLAIDKIDSYNFKQKLEQNLKQKNTSRIIKI